MKSLITTLMLSTLSLSVMADDAARPELDLASLQQEIHEQQQQASRSVVADAMVNLRQLPLDTLVTEISPAVSTAPRS
ncbi:hypothetical protein [Aeromonas molluscorum]|uniref:Uncharacterized protein n=1 Tax=Aeromonas molluscorum 848 TaxID=1268236 RepID=R1GQP2_9GAMM|nr:hypothetical protein [Aeromonas molluscorum]EOD54000.1 hypothetical protein G113_16627 [Aeromonas molluscorum 848]